MTPYEIPLTPSAQTFQIQLASALYSMEVWWCMPALCWMLSISDSSGVPILFGIPLVTGTDLLKQHRHLGLKGSLYVQSAADLNAVPQYNDLGVSGHVYFVTET